MEEKEGNAISISMSSKESADTQMIHNEDTIKCSDHNEVRILKHQLISLKCVVPI